MSAAVPAWWAFPGILLVLALIYIPTVLGGFYAFTDWSGIGGWSFVGLDNFVKIFQTDELVGALKNTIVLAVAFVVLTNLGGLLFALALNRGLKTRYLLRTLLFMPVVLAPIAVSYIWSFIFAFDGPLNQALRGLGLDSWQKDWLADPTLAKLCVLTVMVWQNVGLVMVIYLAGLATVPIEIEEAAAIDGAGRWSRFWHVVLPSIRPAVAIATTLMLVQGLRVFDQIMALTGGGPSGATQTLATEIYQQTLVFGKFGFGAALALLLSALILVFSIFQQLIMRERSATGA
ncbi:sugar ABC transporter permease [Nocardioides panacihumi]|uniref:Sugar ABC transporter permease n=2 Tax=Nocardioides panacihumi TaxID=400774 RepID=A0ABN2R6T1_9ACTN